MVDTEYTLTLLITLLWRLGLGPLVGQVWMLVTPRDAERFALDYFFVNGVKYAVMPLPQSREGAAATIQTAYGIERVALRRVTDADQLARIGTTLMHNRPAYAERVFRASGVQNFPADLNRVPFVAFYPTDGPTPAPLRADLAWVLPALLTLLMLRRMRRR